MNSDSFCELLVDHGIRPTANRILVVKTLERAGRPLSMSEIEEMLVTIDKSIVSRTLALLREHHAVHVIEGAHEGVRYELCHSHDEHADTDTHAHFYCECCHRTLIAHIKDNLIVRRDTVMQPLYLWSQQSRLSLTMYQQMTIGTL